MDDLKSLHDQALGAAAQARKAVENNAMLLQQKLAERTKLLSQLEQAKMQETVARSLESMGSLAAPGTTPSLDEVREKIEQRYATALGRADLASNSVEGRRLEVQQATLDMAGVDAGWRRSGPAWQRAASTARPPATEAGRQPPAATPPPSSTAATGPTEQDERSVQISRGGDQARISRWWRAGGGLGRRRAGWQTGHQNVIRSPSVSRSISVPQRRHGAPPRPYT